MKNTCGRHQTLIMYYDTACSVVVWYVKGRPYNSNSRLDFQLSGLSRLWIVSSGPGLLTLCSVLE